jgi:lysozyme
MPLLNNESNEVLMQQLKRHEGVKYDLYLCTAGKQTIGVGRNLDDVGITDDEAMYLLGNDIKRVGEELEARVSILPELSENRKIVLMNMTFNLGINRLLKFKNFFAALEDKDYQKAADEMLDSIWAKQVGSRANELANIMIVG